MAVSAAQPGPSEPSSSPSETVYPDSEQPFQSQFASLSISRASLHTFTNCTLNIYLFVSLAFMHLFVPRPWYRGREVIGTC